jgi:hypothetical protein
MAAPTPPGKALTSWKEVAAYFGRDIRTVQRWEKEEGLPVHRHLHQRRSSIYAYAEELQTWWQDRGARLSQQPAEGQNGGASSRSWLQWGAAAVALAVFVPFTWFSWRDRSSVTSATPPPAYPFSVLEGMKSPAWLLPDAVADLNADGRPEAVFSTGIIGEVFVVFGGSAALGGNGAAGSAELPSAAGVVIRTTNRSYFAARQVGDFNGDGIPDLLLSESLTEPESLNATGKSYILWGRRKWPRELKMPAEADVTFWIDRPGYTAQMTGCLTPPATRADLNGDGIEDVILGAFEHTFRGMRSSGGAFVFFGRRKWERELEVQSRADVTIEGSRTGESLGNLCAVGDFDGDSRTDLAVVANEGSLWNLLESRGRTYLYSGRAQWPRVMHSEKDAALVVKGVLRFDRPDSLLLGDVNGDGRDDLILGRARYDRDAPGATRQTAGIDIWFGGSRKGTVTVDSADVTLTTRPPIDGYFMAVAAADLDGDGCDDLAVSDPNRGEVRLVYGRKQWKKSGTIEDFGGVPLFRGEREAGSQTMALADLDGSGVPALLFTSPDASTKAGPKTGRAWILRPFSVAVIDVRPEREPNYVYFPEGLVVVRVYGNELTRTDPMDPSSVRLAGATAERHVAGDFNSDGIADLQLHFETSGVRIKPDANRITLTARTASGRLLAGTESITIILNEPKAPASPGPAGAGPH